jgi:Domain of unknown function (DUF5667)
VITGRSAQRFHELVEGASTSGAHLPSYAELLEVVGALRATPAPVPDPAYVAALRERLLVEAESVLTAAAAERSDADARLRLRPATPRVRSRNRRLAAVISGVTLVGVTGTMAVAAQSALPGEGLYPLKRGIESAHAELTFDRAARGRLLLDDAAKRLDEATALSREDTAGSTLVGNTLDDFSQQAVAGSDLLVADYQATGDSSSITSVRTFTATSMARLHQLQGMVPPAADGQLLQAAQALDQVQQVAVHACPSCAGPSVTSVPSVLTDAVQAAADPWLVAQPTRGSGTHQHGGHTGPFGTPHLPHVGGHLPPASVTDPTQPNSDIQIPTAQDVQHTVQHLTGGLTQDLQNELGNTVADTTNNLLDAVGAAGNELANALDGTVGGLGSALPTDLQTLLP